MPHKYGDIEFPEKRKLKFMEKSPQPLYAGQKMPKMPKQLIDMRGPEPTHTLLRHKQYGIRALQGGQLHHGHFEMIRNGINRKLDEARMFAVWRVDPPWKPITKKGQGHRMGGGKGNIDHYTTPVKAKRIILEMGGHVEFHEAYEILVRVAKKLPFKADVVSEKLLGDEIEKNKLDETVNQNPFNFEYCVKNNMMGCRSWISPYDVIWHGEYR
jgi:large subunit ribosomal protein L16